MDKLRLPVPAMEVGDTEETKANDGQVELETLLISRRRWQRGGVRFLCRGLDDDGHTGNCVESELLISTHKHTFSFVQIRGTFPLFWEQKQHGLVTEINLLRPEALTKPKFATHLENLLEDY
jgi:synaptojanin